MAVARVVEIISSSPKSFEDAVRNGVERANQTLSNVSAVWVKNMKCTVDRGRITEFRVNLKVTFVLERLGKSAGEKKRRR